MSEKPTPGPWQLVETPHEKIISSWHIHVGPYTIPVHPYKRIYSADRSHSGLVIDHEHMANCRLMTAAPELLEALQLIVQWDECDLAQTDSLMVKARAAIAKATGGKS